MNVWGVSPLILNGSIIMIEFAKHAPFQYRFNYSRDKIVEVFNNRKWIVEHTLQPVRVWMELCTEVFNVDFLASIEQRDWGVSFRRVDGEE